jgi:hypothetical protein
MTIYVQRKDARQLETVDEFPFSNREERTEARKMREEYRMSDPSAHYYLSRRPCKAWKER